MALQSSGAVSLANIQTEFGGSNPISLSEYYAGGTYVPTGTSGTNGVIPSSGAIGLWSFYGTSSIPPFSATWSGSSIAAGGGYPFGISTSGSQYRLAMNSFGAPIYGGWLTSTPSSPLATGTSTNNSGFIALYLDSVSPSQMRLRVSGGIAGTGAYLNYTPAEGFTGNSTVSYWQYQTSGGLLRAYASGTVGPYISLT